MVLLLVPIKALLICFIYYEEVRGCTSFVDTYCEQHGTILNCEYISHEEMPLLNFGSTCEFNKIFISNFPVLEIGDTSCADTNIKNSYITFKDTPVKQCPSKKIEIRSSYIDRLPREISEIVAYSSTINVLHDIHLKFADIHDSEIKSLSNIKLSSSDVTFFDSRVSFKDTFAIEESSLVKFINSNVTFNKGSHVNVIGELTLHGTTIDAKYIQLTPTSKIHILSPKPHRLSDGSKQSGNDSKENADRRESSELTDTRSESNHDSGEKTAEGHDVLYLTLFVIFLVLFMLMLILLATKALRQRSRKKKVARNVQLH